LALIKLFEPAAQNGCLEALVDVFKSGLWASGAGGPCVRRFEGEFSRYIGCRDTVAVNSGTAALYLALLGLPRIKDHEVILPSLTFVTTAHAVVLAGSRPVFADVQEDTLNLDVSDILAKVTRKTRAIIVVHFGGRPCEMEAIHDIAADKGLFVIEDCAHACGATFRGKRVGSWSHIGCFSFHPVKNLSTFGGGALSINDPSIERSRLDRLRWCGIDAAHRVGSHYDVTDMGWNYYMSEASASLALSQLHGLDAENERRRCIAKFYDKELSGLDWLIPPKYDENSTYHLYAVRVPKHRDGFIEHMAKQGVETGIHYARGVHQFTFYRKKLKSDRLPATERIVRELVSIPIYGSLAENQLRHVVASIKSYQIPM
jgi:dTDP-4-amino-4,6-dideoxygalactose transaminase